MYQLPKVVACVNCNPGGAVCIGGYGVVSVVRTALGTFTVVTDEDMGPTDAVAFGTNLADGNVGIAPGVDTHTWTVTVFDRAAGAADDSFTVTWIRIPPGVTPPTYA